MLHNSHLYHMAQRRPIISSHYISSRSFRPIHFVPRSFCPVHFVPHHFVPKSFRPMIISSQDQFLSHTFCLLLFCTTLILAHTLCPCTSRPFEKSFVTIILTLTLTLTPSPSPSPSPSLSPSPSPLTLKWKRKAMKKMYGTK